MVAKTQEQTDTNKRTKRQNMKLWKLMAVIAMLAVSAASCGLSEIGGEDNSGTDGGIWGGPVEENNGEGILQQICYMTALDYQNGYDWRADTARESVKCSLIVYADGKQIMKVPVGEEYETGADVDMHRMAGGHLYTDYSTSEETIIKRDGRLLFRYPGPEAIHGMCVSGDDVYTLGQSRNGEGFSFRKNGEAVIARNNGYVIGTLETVNDSLCFAFYENIKSAEGVIGRYYSVRGGKVSQIGLRDDIKKVWDIMHCDDFEMYAASLTGIAAPVLFTRKGMTAIPIPSKATLLSVDLFGNGNSPGAEIMYMSGSAIYCSIWQNGATVMTFPKDRTISSLCSPDDGACCTVNPSSSSPGLIYRCGELHEMPSGYSCIGDKSICMVNGILHVGLSSRTMGGPIVWKDGETETLKINGYIASISAH